MNYSEFTNEIEGIIGTRLPKCSVQIRDIVKNNNVILSGLTIKADDINAAPTIYLEQFYENYRDGEDLDSITEEILHLYDRNKLNENYDFSYIEDYESAKCNMFFKAVNFKNNKQFLKDVPYFEFEDLALVPYILIDDETFGSATVVIHQELFERWCIDKNTLYEDVMHNMKYDFDYEFQSISDVLSEISGIVPNNEAADMGMYVLTPVNKLYGAALIAVDSVMNSIADSLQSDFYIIPSSVHELIIIKSCDKDMLNKLNEMINEVNDTVVSNEDILADHAYYFEREWGIIQ